MIRLLCLTRMPLRLTTCLLLMHSVLLVVPARAACFKQASACDTDPSCTPVTTQPRVDTKPECNSGNNGWVADGNSCGLTDCALFLKCPCGRKTSKNLCTGTFLQEARYVIDGMELNISLPNRRFTLDRTAADYIWNEDTQVFEKHPAQDSIGISP